MTRPFCGDCTRARLSSDGKIFTCLFADHGTDLREPLRAGVSDDELLVVGVNTAHAWAIDGGRVWPRRARELEQQLRDQKGSRFAIVMLHHPPVKSGIPSMDALGLQSPESFGAIIERNGNVERVICGHVHRTMFLSWNGIPCASLDNFGADKAKGRAPTLGLLACGGEGVTLIAKPLT